MKVAVAVATRNRPTWVRLFLLQMANQTRKPDIVVVYENGQEKSMKEVCLDIPVNVDFLYTSEKQKTPDFAIPALQQAIEQHEPDVVFMMNDDNFYYSEHIELTLAGLEDGKFDVSYLAHGNFLTVHGDILEYFQNLEWKKLFGNLGLDDGFAMTTRAARQYLAYLKYASAKCKEKGWTTDPYQKRDCPATDHHSDGIRFACLLHPEKHEYEFLRNINIIAGGTSAWVHHGENLCSPFDGIWPLVATLKKNKLDSESKKLWEEGRI